MRAPSPSRPAAAAAPAPATKRALARTSGARSARGARRGGRAAPGCRRRARHESRPRRRPAPSCRPPLPAGPHEGRSGSVRARASAAGAGDDRRPVCAGLRRLRLPADRSPRAVRRPAAARVRQRAAWHRSPRRPHAPAGPLPSGPLLKEAAAESRRPPSASRSRRPCGRGRRAGGAGIAQHRRRQPGQRRAGPQSAASPGLRRAAIRTSSTRRSASTTRSSAPSRRTSMRCSGWPRSRCGRATARRLRGATCRCWSSSPRTRWRKAG